MERKSGREKKGEEGRGTDVVKGKWKEGENSRKGWEEYSLKCEAEGCQLMYKYVTVTALSRDQHMTVTCTVT